MPPPAPLAVSIDTARRFVRRAGLLDTPVLDAATALDHLGYVQIDPVNVCGRMHDLILRNRVTGYRAGDLHAHIHAAERRGFEHYLRGGHGVLVAFPLEAWPYLTAGMMQRRHLRGAHSGRLTPRETALAERILAEIASRGPLTSGDIEHEGRARSAWGRPGRLVKHVLEKLFAHGRLLISGRRDFRRVYDLPERVLPRSVLDQAPRAEAEVRTWLVLQRLRQRRLVNLSSREAALAADHVQPVAVDGLPGLYCLKSDAWLFDAVQAEEPPVATPVLLAPLDPLIYDRVLTRRLWNFDYRWEAYTPPAKRKRGHYALPVLAGTEIVGHVDPKADRRAGELLVLARRVRRGHRVAGAIRELATFLCLGA
ncbi:MAG TPA: crosslink repair DNA glycosylase YcaQ family protein [Opitutaceae bacterium]|nr:crosslink repair DNA glycosylase YcaQ family protein [Opitutaceae bacterium]